MRARTGTVTVTSHRDWKFIDGIAYPPPAQQLRTLAAAPHCALAANVRDRWLLCDWGHDAAGSAVRPPPRHRLPPGSRSSQVPSHSERMLDCEILSYIPVPFASYEHGRICGGEVVAGRPSGGSSLYTVPVQLREQTEQSPPPLVSVATIPWGPNLCVRILLEPVFVKVE